MKKLFHSLVITGYVVFVVCVLFYTMLKVHGYKYDIGAGQMLLTGIVDITTQPKGAEIYIDGGKFTDTSNTIIRPEPGNRILDLKKEGFRPIQKEIIVELNDAVQINERLLPNKHILKPEHVIKNIDALSQNEYDVNIFALANNEEKRIFTYNMQEKKIEKAFEMEKATDLLVWKDRNTLVVRDTENNSFSLDLISGEKNRVTPREIAKLISTDKEKEELVSLAGFLADKNIRNFKVSWSDQKLLYNDEFEVFSCDLKNETCRTELRLSSPIRKTLYSNSGIFIQTDKEILLYDYQSLRTVIETDNSLPVSYLENSGEIIFSSGKTLYRWQVFYE